jgi:hypothetical protein
MLAKFYVEFKNGTKREMALTNQEAQRYWYSSNVKTIKPVYADEQLPLFSEQAYL